VQQHTCRQFVPAVLKLRVYRSVGKCSTKADSSTHISKTVPLSLLQPVGATIGLGSAQRGNVSVLLTAGTVRVWSGGETLLFGEAKVCSLSIVELDGTVNSIKLLVVAQNAFMALLMSLATVKIYYIFMWNVRHFCPILNKFQVTRQIFHKSPSMKFQRNLSIARHGDMLTDGHT
jgi:hypothetical protein